MKKFFKFFSIAALAFCTVSLVSCQDENGENGEATEDEPEAVAVLIDEQFETMPTDWTLIDADGDGFNWEIGYGENSGQGPYISGIDGSNCISSASWDATAGALTPDNYLVSPEIYIHSTGGYTLTWYDAAQDANYPSDNYTVYAGTLDNGVFTPLATLHTQVIESGDYTLRSASLDEFKKQNIRIAFRHHDCSDWFVMKIDNVKVSNDGSKGPATCAVKEGVKKVK